MSERTLGVGEERAMQIFVLERFLNRAENFNWLKKDGSLKPSKANIAFEFLQGAYSLCLALDSAGIRPYVIPSGFLLACSVSDPIAETRRMLALLRERVA
jgi:hypothetical protein